MSDGNLKQEIKILKTKIQDYQGFLADFKQAYEFVKEKWDQYTHEKAVRKILMERLGNDRASYDFYLHLIDVVKYQNNLSVDQVDFLEALQHAWTNKGQIDPWLLNNLPALGMLLEKYKLSPKQAAEYYVLLHDAGFKNPLEISNALAENEDGTEGNSIEDVFAKLTSGAHVMGRMGYSGQDRLRIYNALQANAAAEGILPTETQIHIPALIHRLTAEDFYQSVGVDPYQDPTQKTPKPFPILIICSERVVNDAPSNLCN